MIKVGLCGTHGTGKTTKANELEDHFADLGKKVYMVREVARNCPYTLGTLEAQDYIWNHQMRLEQHAVMQDVDVVICDRTVMDNLMYYRDILDQTKEYAVYDLWARWWVLYREAKEWMPTYDQVIRLPLNLEWLQADDPIRPKSETYARRIDALFDRFVQPFVTGDNVV